MAPCSFHQTWSHGARMMNKNQEIISFSLPAGKRVSLSTRSRTGYKLSYFVAHPDFLVLFGIRTYKPFHPAKIDAGKSYPWTAFALYCMFNSMSRQ
jgi:hypothetical protein